MPGTMTAGGKTPPPILATFEDALSKLPGGYVDTDLALWRGA